jgi:hypothetical protein
MTTSYETNTRTVSASYDAEPKTQTFRTAAAAWASSPLGQPDSEVGYGFGEPAETVAAETIAEERRRGAKHTVVALALAGGIAAGAALGLMFVDFTPDQPIVVPGSTPEHAVVVTETGQPEKVPTAVAPAPAHEPAPAVVDTASPSTVGGSSKVVDVPVSDPSPQPDTPQAAEPEDPNPGPDDAETPGPQDPGLPPQEPPHPPGQGNPGLPGDKTKGNPTGPVDPGPKFEPPIVLPAPSPEPPSGPGLDLSDKTGS